MLFSVVTVKIGATINVHGYHYIRSISTTLRAESTHVSNVLRYLKT